MTIMKSFLKSILIIFCSLQINSSTAQIEYVEDPVGYVCGNYDSQGDGIRTRVWPTPIDDDFIEFRVRKTEQGNGCSAPPDPVFGTSGVLYLRENSPTGPIKSSCNLSSCGGGPTIDIGYTADFTVGTREFYVTIEAAGFIYEAGPILVCAANSCVDGATINITEPDTGDTYFEGDNMPIQWSGSLNGSSCKVGILYQVNEGPWITITNSTNDDGLYNWTVPSGINSTNVDIGITYLQTDFDCNEVNDEENNFSIFEDLDPQLEFSQCIDAPALVPFGENLNATMEVRNYGSSSWTGDLVVSISNGSTFQNIYVNTNHTIGAGDTYFINTGNDQITLPPSPNYSVLCAYSNAPINGGDAFVDDNGCTPTTDWGSSGQYTTHHSTLFVVNVAPNLELDQAMSISPQPVVQNSAATFSATAYNVGASPWEGNIVLQLLDEFGGYIADLDVPTYVTIDELDDYTITHSTSGISSPPGNYQLRLQHQTNGAGPYVTTDANGFQNPLPFVIDGNTGPCSNFTDLTPGTEEFEAAQCLCEAGYIQDNMNIFPYNTLIREDLAKVAFLAVNQNDDYSIAEIFPVPFADLQDSGTGYHKYAKALSYLEYGDGISPFDRVFTNFYPGNNIQRRYALKVLLETFDINISYSNGGTIEGQVFGDDAYEYLKTAKDLGIISGNYPDATDDVLRIDAFIMLSRIIGTVAGCPTDCDLNCYPKPNESLINGDYFVPGNFILDNLARNVGMSEGYFDQYSRTSFSLPATNLLLEFTHLYNNYLLEIPSDLRKICPLGEGWSHSYNSYIISQDASDGITEKLYVFWPDGSIHQYDRSSLNAESKGVFDTMTESGIFITVKKKNQIEYTYRKYGDEWYLDKIEDRNGNYIDIQVQSVSTSNGIQYRTNWVRDDQGRELNFFYQNGTTILNRVREVTGNRNIYFTVNSNGDLVSYTNPKGNITSYDYGSGQLQHYLETITLPENNSINVSYNANRKLQSVLFPGVSNNFDIEVDENYSSSSAYQTTLTDPSNGISVLNQFDEDGYVEYFESNTSSTNIGYNNDKLPASVNDNGQNSSFVYDNNGNLTQVNQPLNISHSFTYNSLNDITSYTDPKGNTSTFTYDSNGNLNKIFDNLGFETDYNFNGSGLLTSVSNPANITTSFSYDNHGNRTAVNLPLGINTSYSYDNLSRLVQIENALNQITNYSYDLHNQITEMERVSSGGNVSTNYGFDDNDNLTSITNALNQVTSFTYNDRDLVETMTFGNDTKSYTYREDNLLEQFTRPNGQVLNFDYDVQGRTIDDGYASYTYDTRSNIKTIVKNGTTTFNYDAIDRLTSCNDIYGRVVSYSYDQNSNITEIAYPGNYDVDYVHDDNNRLTQVKFNNGSRTIQYSYLDDGRLQQITFPNGVSTDYSYDAAGRMIGLETKKSNGTIICNYDFTLDALGNHIGLSSTEPFDAPHLADISYTGTYNGENEMLNYAGNDFEHNNNGEQTDKNGRQLNWDIGGMITSNGNLDYVYDGMKLMREADRAGDVRQYAWDVQGIGNIVVEYDGSGNALYYYIHGIGLCARVSANNNNDIHYYHGDFRGSIIAMTNSSQVVTHKYQYLPYGKMIQYQEANENPFKYVGKLGVMHEGGHHYYMRARQYDADTGVFLSEDPVWHENLYTYAENNPITFTDPTGNVALSEDEIVAIMRNTIDYLDKIGVKEIQGVSQSFLVTELAFHLSNGDFNKVGHLLFEEAGQNIASYTITAIGTAFIGASSSAAFLVGSGAYAGSYFTKALINGEEWADLIGHGERMHQFIYDQSQVIGAYVDSIVDGTIKSAQKKHTTVMQKTNNILNELRWRILNNVW